MSFNIDPEDEAQIRNTFDLLKNDCLNYATIAASAVGQYSIKAITEVWAAEIIKILTSRSLYPPLKISTIKRRVRRGQNILGADYPLLEAGEWILFIEFRIVQKSDVYHLEVGVFDDETLIGHSDSADPVWLAKANEYGNLKIPARMPFVKSELHMNTRVDRVITDTWEKLSGETTSGIVLDRRINASIRSGGETAFTNFHAVGRIFYSGTTFKFRWDDEMG